MFTVVFQALNKEALAGLNSSLTPVLSFFFFFRAGWVQFRWSFKYLILANSPVELVFQFSPPL